MKSLTWRFGCPQAPAPITPAHALAITAGGIILAAATNATVVKFGGYMTANGGVTVALSIGVFVTAFVLGHAFKTAPLPALAMLLGLIAGEAYNLGLTGEATMIAREEAFAPLLKANKARATVKARLTEVRTAAPSTARLTLAKHGLFDAKAGVESNRVRIARDDLGKAEAAVTAEAKNIACKTECHRLEKRRDDAQWVLTEALKAEAGDRAGQIAKAEAEVKAALVDAAVVHAKEVSDAEQAVEANPEPSVSPTVLADKTGQAAWKIDLAFASLRAIAINLMAAALVGFGAKGFGPVGHAEAVLEARLGQPQGQETIDPDLAELRTMMTKPLPDSHNGPAVADVIQLKRPDRLNPGQSGPGPSGKGGPKRPDRPVSGSGLSKSEALDDLMQRLADGRTIESQDVLASDWNRPKQTVSDWLREWRRIGVIPAPVQSGRCKVTVGG